MRFSISISVFIRFSHVFIQSLHRPFRSFAHFSSNSPFSLRVSLLLFRMRLLFLLLLFIPLSFQCLLCPLNTPPRPRPLDQFKIPSIPKVFHSHFHLNDSFSIHFPWGDKVHSQFNVYSSSTLIPFPNSAISLNNCLSEVSFTMKTQG